MTVERATLLEPMMKNRLTILRALGALILAALVGLSGCTSRAVTVTSLPPGADVTINRRHVGKTPVRVNYTHYGSYRVELRKDRYETLVRKEHLRPPWYGYDPFAFVADNVIPARVNDEAYLHYVLEPVPKMEMSERQALMARANLARDGKAVNPVTQEAVAIAWAPRERKATAVELDTTGLPKKKSEEPPIMVGPKPTPEVALPSELQAPKGITERPPEAVPPAPGTEPKPVKDPGTTKVEPPPVVKDPDVTRPTPPGPKPVDPDKADPKKPPQKQPPLPVKRMRRTPKGEILIYDEPVIEDPSKK